MANNKKDGTVNIQDADTHLREKLGGSGALGKLFTAERVSKGQKVIEDFKLSFFGEMNVHLNNLRRACDGEIDVEAVRETAKALKGQAETLGFDFLFAVSDALYQYLGGRKQTLSEGQAVVLQKHAESLILAIERQERGKGGVTELQLVEQLALLRKKFP